MNSQFAFCENEFKNLDCLLGHYEKTNMAMENLLSISAYINKYGVTKELRALVSNEGVLSTAAEYVKKFFIWIFDSIKRVLVAIYDIIRKVGQWIATGARMLWKLITLSPDIIPDKNANSPGKNKKPDLAENRVTQAEYKHPRIETMVNITGNIDAENSFGITVLDLFTKDRNSWYQITNEAAKLYYKGLMTGIGHTSKAFDGAGKGIAHFRDELKYLEREATSDTDTDSGFARSVNNAIYDNLPYLKTMHEKQNKSWFESDLAKEHREKYNAILEKLEQFDNSVDSARPPSKEECIRACKNIYSLYMEYIKSLFGNIKGYSYVIQQIYRELVRQRKAGSMVNIDKDFSIPENVSKAFLEYMNGQLLVTHPMLAFALAGEEIRSESIVERVIHPDRNTETDTETTALIARVWKTLNDDMDWGLDKITIYGGNNNDDATNAFASPLNKDKIVVSGAMAYNCIMSTFGKVRLRTLLMGRRILAPLRADPKRSLLYVLLHEIRHFYDMNVVARLSRARYTSLLAMRWHPEYNATWKKLLAIAIPGSLYGAMNGEYNADTAAVTYKSVKVIDDWYEQFEKEVKAAFDEAIKQRDEANAQHFDYAGPLSFDDTIN